MHDMAQEAHRSSIDTGESELAKHALCVDTKPSENMFIELP